MDALITAAARALAAGDALGALKGVALREDPPALALRGIAMAQLGEHPRARELLRRAARGFGAREPLSRARCVVAEAEVALAMRDLDATPRALENAVAVLEAQADHVNASQGRLVLARRQLLLGRLDAAAATLAVLARGRLSPALAAIAQLVRAELALRGLRTGAARAALERADEAALHAGIPALRAEVADARSLLARPAAAPAHRRRTVAATGRGGNPARFRRIGDRCLPARTASGWRLVSAGATAGAVRIGARAGRSLAG